MRDCDFGFRLPAGRQGIRIADLKIKDILFHFEICAVFFFAMPYALCAMRL